MKIVAVSGGFDPVHAGHIRLFQEARNLGDQLIVILNNDNWLTKKKGYVFMPQEQREKILAELKSVTYVHLTGHTKNDSDMTVCSSLEILRPSVFANGGDRESENTPEVELCNRLGIELAFGVGGEKIESSSELVRKAMKHL